MPQGEKPKRIVWDRSTGLAKGFDHRGRPKGSGKEYNYLRDSEGYEKVPEELILDEEAPVDLLVAASMANWLNGYPMDDNVRNMCSRWGVDADQVNSDRRLYAGQIQRMRDSLKEKYSERIMDLASWMMNQTTAGMGSVMAAMTGDYTKYGNPRNKE